MVYTPRPRLSSLDTTHDRTYPLMSAIPLPGSGGSDRRHRCHDTVKSRKRLAQQLLAEGLRRLVTSATWCYLTHPHTLGHRPSLNDRGSPDQCQPSRANVTCYGTSRWHSRSGFWHRREGAHLFRADVHHDRERFGDLGLRAHRRDGPRAHWVRRHCHGNLQHAALELETGRRVVMRRETN